MKLAMILPPLLVVCSLIIDPVMPGLIPQEYIEPGWDGIKDPKIKGYDRCILKIDPGNCTNQKGVFKKPYKTWGFDRLALECKQFEVCDKRDGINAKSGNPTMGNENQFASVGECHNFCAATKFALTLYRKDRNHINPDPPLAAQPKSTDPPKVPSYDKCTSRIAADKEISVGGGSSTSGLKVWTFDRIALECKVAIIPVGFGHNDTNANKFNSKEECTKVCESTKKALTAFRKP